MTSFFSRIFLFFFGWECIIQCLKELVNILVFFLKNLFAIISCISSLVYFEKLVISAYRGIYLLAPRFEGTSPFQIFISFNLHLKFFKGVDWTFANTPLYYNPPITFLILILFIELLWLPIPISFRACKLAWFLCLSNFIHFMHVNFLICKVWIFSNGIASQSL